MRFSRFLTLLALLAVLLAPAGMIGSHAAMAMPAAATQPMDHCAEGQDESAGKSEMIDCAIACAAMTTAEPLIPQETALLASAPNLLAASFIEGMRPEAATPPPRSA